MGRVLVTGGAGFIGSHICDKLVDIGHEVVCFDNLMTGSKGNIAHLEGVAGFIFVEGDIRDVAKLGEAMEECTHVNHQAALGSVPRSIKNPTLTNEININGSLNVLLEAQRHSIKRVVFASSSSVYGDNADMPKREERTGKLLSPYAVTKSAFEDYAKVFHLIHGIETIGLRYFNVFGPRQSPKGAYAAVIPIFMQSILEGRSPTIFGDGEQTRDFTYIQNTVEANILALFEEAPKAYGGAFNIACARTVSINVLFELIHSSISSHAGLDSIVRPEYGPSRQGDIKDSLADLSKVSECLGYSPMVTVEQGISETVRWFVENSK
jgi:UDP-N-acetylglucosamine 4-epimerase